MGYEWLPFIGMGWPWFQLDHGLFLPGLVYNAVFLYALGMFVQYLWHRFTRAHE